ncbi:MAG: nucleotidyltransferase family protein [Pseudomonadales bacterium]
MQQNSQPGEKPPPNIAAVLLAAGESRRFGGSKLAQPVNGVAMVQHCLRQLQPSCESRIVVVLGAHADIIEPLLEGTYCSHCPEYRQGMGRSLAWGVGQAVTVFNPDAILVSLADQVALTSADFAALVRASGGGSTLAAAQNTVKTGTAESSLNVGVPAIFPQAYFAPLQALQGDQGAREILRRSAHVLQGVSMPHAGIDVDTPEDLQRFIASQN